MKLDGVLAFITGGAGFVGSHLADLLLQRGNEVVAYDNFNPFYSGKERNVAQNLHKNGYRLVRSDILDYPTLVKAMEGSDIVFHQAAQPGVRYSIEHPLESHEINVTGTLNVLLAAKELKIPKVIFASSSSVYGVPLSLPMSEDHPTNPNSPYAASKLAAEKYCKVFSEIYGLDVVMLRYFSVYGPRGRPDQVIKSFVDKVALGLSPVIYGDGGQTRDFTYVSDVVDANILAAEGEGVSGEVFNVGFGRQVEIKKLAEMIIDLMGKTGEIPLVYEESYAGDFPDTCADIAKASRLLGYSPKVDLKEGLKRFVSWYQANTERQKSRDQPRGIP